MRIGKPVMMETTPHGPPNSKLHMKRFLTMKNDNIRRDTYVSWLSRRLSASFPSFVTTNFEDCAEPLILWRKVESTAIAVGWKETDATKKNWKVDRTTLWHFPFWTTLVNNDALRCHRLQNFSSQNHHHRCYKRCPQSTISSCISDCQYIWHLLCFTSSVQGRTSREWPSTALAYLSLIWSVKS